MNRFRTASTISRTIILSIAALFVLLPSSALQTAIAASPPTGGPASLQYGTIHITPSVHWLQTHSTTTSGSTNVTYHGGPVMHTSTTYAIFWLPSGYTFEEFGNSSSYVSLIERYFHDVGGSLLYNILTQYSDSVNGKPLNSSTFGGAFVDTTPYPNFDPTSQPLSDGQIQNEVVNAMSQTGWTPGPTKEFFVFTASGVQSCMDSAMTQCSYNTYCAYHGAFNYNGQTVMYANMPDDDGNLQSCTTWTGSFPNGDPVADAEISTLSHEHFESVSDPQVSNNPAWIDASGNEIGDKCGYNYGSVSSSGSNVTLNGHPYLVQQEWSNAVSGCALSYSTPTTLSWHHATSPTTNSLSAVSCPSASTCYAAGVAGTVLTTTNGGGTWTARSTGTTSALAAITCSSTTSCIAVGAAGTIITTSNGGSAWYVRTSGTTYNLLAVACAGSSTCFAVGAGGTLLASTNAGATWARQTTGTTATLNAIACSAGGTCDAVGTAGTIFFRA